MSLSYGHVVLNRTGRVGDCGINEQFSTQTCTIVSLYILYITAKKPVETGRDSDPRSEK